MMNVQQQKGFLRVLQIAQEVGYFKPSKDKEKIEQLNKVCKHGNFVIHCEECKARK